jgi:hypothetical protein
MGFFSRTKQNKSKSHTRITDVMRTNISEIEQNVNCVPEQMQAQIN